MKKLILYLLAFSAPSCSYTEKKPDVCRVALKESIKLIQAKNTAGALEALADTPAGCPAGDSVASLRADLEYISAPNLVETQARVLNGQKGGWDKLSANQLSASELGIKLPVALPLIRAALLDIKPKLPALEKQHIAEAATQKREQAARQKREAAALEADNYEKRGEIAAKLRESFLDQNMDVEVKVSGKRRSRITLSYALMGAVMEHQMEKAGNISTLLDLGFTEVELTDGDDFDKVWRRTH